MRPSPLHQHTPTCPNQKSTNLAQSHTPCCFHRCCYCCRIVSLVDIFEIDNNTFATVLELVQGGDLDAYCKLHEVRAKLLLGVPLSSCWAGLG